MTSINNIRENGNDMTGHLRDFELLSSYHLDELNQLVSHELRTPLTAIRGALGLLASGRFGPFSDKSRRLLAIAINNTNRLVRLTQAIENDPAIPLTLVSSSAMARLRLETDLRSAVDQNQLQVFYQPIVELQSNHIKGFEALARWHHSDRGWISPAEFIPLAEEIGIVHKLGLFVLRQACQQLALWHKQFPAHPLSISVNLSTVQLSEPNLVPEVAAVLAATGVPPQSIRLEITESAILDHSQEAIARLKQLQHLGIQLYLDDFGTGYSSLARLQDMPVDVLKIDRSFVCSQNWNLIEVIMLLAANLGLKAIVEGVETPEELQHLRGLGCQLVQGYIFSEPLNAIEISTLLVSQPWQSLQEPRHAEQVLAS
jgi:EAL domain-containing protein (putative c-di-GMP-specific phosphodiesterase class I)